MAVCKWCNQSFVEVKPWQLFCSARHRDDWHLHQGKLARQARLMRNLAKQENVGRRIGSVRFTVVGAVSVIDRLAFCYQEWMEASVPNLG